MERGFTHLDIYLLFSRPYKEHAPTNLYLHCCVCPVWLLVLWRSTKRISRLCYEGKTLAETCFKLCWKRRAPKIRYGITIALLTATHNNRAEFVRPTSAVPYVYYPDFSWIQHTSGVDFTTPLNVPTVTIPKTNHDSLVQSLQPS